MEENTTTTTPQPSKNNTLIIVAVVVIVLIVAFGVWQFGLKGKSAQNESMQAMSPTPSEGAAMEASPSAAAASTYKDGTYSATGHYANPSTPKEAVDISITIKDGKVTAATFTGHPDNPTTTVMQSRFKQGFTSEVVGKDVNAINLTVVNGSSLTPKGFMDALSQIKTQAKA